MRVTELAWTIVSSQNITLRAMFLLTGGRIRCSGGRHGGRICYLDRCTSETGLKASYRSLPTAVCPLWSLESFDRSFAVCPSPPQRQQGLRMEAAEVQQLPLLRCESVYLRSVGESLEASKAIFGRVWSLVFRVEFALSFCVC